MAFIQYYWHVLSVAFSGAWAFANIISFVLSILLGFYVWRRPHKEGAIKNLLWIIPLGAFIVIFITSVIIVAPYKIYNEQQQIINGLKIEIEKATQKQTIAANTKKDIRNFFEAVNPEILQRIDKGEKIIYIHLSFQSQERLKRLMCLSYFNDFLYCNELKTKQDYDTLKILKTKIIQEIYKSYPSFHPGTDYAIATKDKLIK